MKSLFIGLLVLLALNSCFGKKGGGGGKKCKAKALCAVVAQLKSEVDDLKKKVEEQEHKEPAHKAESCKDLYDQGQREDKAYEIHVGSEKVNVYCHMSAIDGCGSGGFTLVMKTDGSKDTFRYDSALWSNDETYDVDAGSTGFDSRETKLPTFSETEFHKVCIGMKHGGKNRFISTAVSAHSLHDLIAHGQYHATHTGRDAWKSLLGTDASLQRACNKEGFNVQPVNFVKARIGIVSNQENECLSCDSYIAIGGSHTPTTGDRAYWFPDNGDKELPAIGYVLVQ